MGGVLLGIGVVSDLKETGPSPTRVTVLHLVAHGTYRIGVDMGSQNFLRYGLG